MNKQRFPHPLILFWLVLIISALACNLTSEPPPTLAPRQPRSTLTPQQPIGPQATLGLPPTNQPLPSGATSNLPDNQNVAQLIQAVDAERMMRVLQSLVGFQNRNPLAEVTENSSAVPAALWLQNELRAIQQANPQTQITVDLYGFNFTHNGQTYNSQNVIMVINGTEVGRGVILVGAHYDTIGTERINSYQPGANDNGSGVAAVLEIARILAQRPRRSTIVLALFSAEELGKYGSVDLARNFFRQQNIPLKGVINLDQIGNSIGVDGRTRYDYQMRAYSATPNTSPSRQLARLTEFAARVYVPEMQVNIIDALDRQGRWGDHESFSDAGYPAVRLIEQDDNPFLVHNERDTISRVDSAYLRRVTQVTLAALLVLADGPPAPELRTMNRTTWRLEWAQVPDADGYVVALRYPGSLKYDQFITVRGATDMTWESFENYEAVTVAAFDANGQLGPFSPEQLINAPPAFSP
jgi:hypothetical protein